MLAGLNVRQLEAAVQIHGALLVVAGAGTGKTRVITLRIAQMIRSGVRPLGIVGLSFTNKAAREMRERLSQSVGSRVASQVTLSTFHSFALSILREYPEAVGLSSGFGIIDDGDSFSLLREAMKEAGVGEFFAVPYVREKISKLKDELVSPATAAKSKAFVDAIMIAKVYDSYERRLRLYNLVDFDDLIFLAYRVLRESDGVCQALRQRYSHVLVDEYQDTSNSQFEFLRLLVSEKGNICVVGDDDQSIYGWRGAHPGILKKFLETFDGAKKVTLDQNYRCSPVILEAANAVIKINPGRLEKQLWSERTDADRIRLFRASNEAEEATFVAETVLNLCSRGVAPSQIAVLYRSSVLSRAVEHAFITLGVPYHISGGTRMSDRKEVRDILSLLVSTLNSKDLRSRFRALEVLGIKVTLANQEKMVLDGKIDPRCEQALGDFAQRVVDCASAADLAQALRIWFDQSCYRTKLRHESSSMERALQREELLERFFGVIGSMDEHEPGSSVIESVCNRFALGAYDVERPQDAARVQFLTIHSSKGLEFEHVFLVGLEEGILPHERSLEQGTENEERRLMYVAMTRAKQALYLSCSLTRSSGLGGQKGHGSSHRVVTKNSRYLDDIPVQLVDTNFVSLESVEAKRLDAARRLFEMFR
jgi:superfamily I DNA/RNA helicase